MRTNKIKKANNMLLGGLLVAIIMVAAALMSVNIAPAKAAITSAKFTLNGVEDVVSTVDPVEIVTQETSMAVGSMKIKSFTISVPTTGSVLYTNEWIYANTPLREGAYEYAFEWNLGANAYKLSEKKQGGGTYVPIDGIVISRDTNSWESAKIGDKLTKNITLPSYYGAVVIEGSGNSTLVADKEIRIPIKKLNGKRNENEIVYYNTEWGKTTGQNEFGTEAFFELGDNDSFLVRDVRTFRDTTQYPIDSRSFALSIHGDARRGLLLADEIIKKGDKAHLVDMKFVDLNKSLSSKLTASNPTAPIKPTDLDDLNGNKPFPGYRAENYLIYYDSSYDKSGNPGSAGFENFTGCNDWGYEVLVKQTSAAGVYPKKGIITDHNKQIGQLSDEGVSFILSGNGNAETFLRNGALNGAEVTVAENGAVTITSTPASYVTTAEAKFKTANQSMVDAVNAKYKLNYIGSGDTAQNNKWTRAVAEIVELLGSESDTKEANSLYGLQKKLDFLNSENIISNSTLADFYGKYLEIQVISDEINAMSVQGLAVMSIAAWHRPVMERETSTAEIRKTLELFKSVNVNTVYLETLWNGYSMSNNSEFVDYHINFKNNDYAPYSDYLDAFISEAHKLGIEVHAWVEDFFVGYENFTESNILTGKKPNSSEHAPDKAERAGWVIKDYQNNEFTQFEGGKYKFIDPSNPQVRDFLAGYYEEILSKYDLDGINLDYIRYPVQNFYAKSDIAGTPIDETKVPRDHGYSEFAAKKFLAEQGVPESSQNLAYLKRQLDKSKTIPESKVDALHAKWIEFKTRQVNEFVEQISKMVKKLEIERKKEVNKDKYSETNIIVSTAVFADADVSTKKNQDWNYWVQQGLIEVATPMAYYTNANTVTQKIQAMVNKINKVSFNYGGIAPYFMGLNPYEEVIQALSSIKGGAFGTVIFDSKTFMNSPEAVKLLQSGVYGSSSIVPHKSLDKMLPAFADEMKSRAQLYDITGDKLTAYNKRFDDLAALKSVTVAEIKAIMKEVYDIQSNARKYASGHAITRIAEEMENLNKVLDVHLSRAYIEQEGWIPANGARPDTLTPPPVDPTPQPKPEPTIPDEGCAGCGSLISGGYLVVYLSVAFVLILVSVMVLKRKKNKN